MSIDVRAGPWSFVLPDDWQDASSDPAVPYFENTSGTWGCYVKVVQFAATDAAPDLAALAERVQKFHEASLAAAPDTSWAVQARAATASAETAESIIDYLDVQRQYRIVSVVQVAPPLGAAPHAASLPLRLVRGLAGVFDRHSRVGGPWRRGGRGMNRIATSAVRVLAIAAATLVLRWRNPRWRRRRSPGSAS